MTADLPPATPIAHPGTVYLVGAGPGAVDLITVRGYRLVAQADVLVVDNLADPQVYAQTRGKIVHAGKRAGDHGMAQDAINQLLIDEAKAGHAVVRLKGGDPYVLGRGSEEALALAQAGVPFEVVPGISSSLAAPLLAGIPVTHRGVADAFVVVSAHPRDGAEGSPADPLSLATVPPYHPRCTLVVLMGVSTLDKWVQVARRQGYPDNLPVAFVTWAARPEQRVLVTTLGQALQDSTAHGLRSPTVAIAGHVVALRSAILSP